MTSDSTQWPVLNERAPFATATRSGPALRLPRSAWLLTGLAFLCGGLVSAAGFSIGWRHQAQRDTAARSALAAATARTHRLEQRIGALRTSLADARSAAARARASATAAGAAEQALTRTGTKVAADATASNGEAASVSSGAGSLTTAATRIARELKTFDTYLTTTPTGQLDAGYIASQTSDLERQLTPLEGDTGGLSSALASFEAALHKLSRDTTLLENH
jgi:chromosome segregation ATPase